jgi:hypothetical protein
MSNYAPTWNPAIWNKDLGGFVDDDARMAMLRKFSTDIGKEIYTVQMAKGRRRGGGTQEELTEGVKTRLDKLDRNCTARHSGKDCPFVRTIKEYLDPSKRSDTTVVSKIRHLRHREITKVDMEVLIENHMSRFTSRAETTPSTLTTCKPKTDDEREEKSEPYPPDLQFADNGVAVGALLGRFGADLVLGARSVLGSSSSTRDW